MRKRNGARPTAPTPAALPEARLGGPAPVRGPLALGEFAGRCGIRKNTVERFLSELEAHEDVFADIFARLLALAFRRIEARGPLSGC